jgi:elongator complex protein 3
VGHRRKIEELKPDLDKIKILTTRYEASQGKEIFLSAEDPETDTLIGYLRLRIPSPKAFRPEILKIPSAIVRELHVYGPLVQVGKHSTRAWQHRGFGATLLSEAERIAQEDYDLKKILVISALGTKRYYTRLGYEHDGVYVSKILGK